MADITDPNGGAAPDAAQPQMPSIQVAAQYIKDLSFENPSMGLNIQRPQIDFTVDLQARKMQENGPYEVVIKMRVTAQQEQRTLRRVGSSKILVPVSLIKFPIESVVLPQVEPKLGAIFAGRTPRSKDCTLFDGAGSLGGRGSRFFRTRSGSRDSLSSCASTSWRA